MRRIVSQLSETILYLSLNRFLNKSYGVSNGKEFKSRLGFEHFKIFRVTTGNFDSLNFYKVNFSVNFFELAFSINSEYFNNVNFSRLITWKFYDAKFFQVYNSEIVLFFFFKLLRQKKFVH